MKLIRQIAKQLGPALLLTAFIMQAASAQTSVLTVKARVQVSGENVTLADVVSSGDSNFPHELVLCRAPELGTVRTLDRHEIAELLRKRGLDIRLDGPQQISILRLGRRISPEDLRPIIEAALKNSGSTATLSSVTIQSAMMTAPESTLELSRLKFDAATLSYRAWFVVMKKDGAKLPRRVASFEAVATLSGGGAPVALDLSPGAKIAAAPISAQATTPAPLLVRHGESAMMRLEGEGFQAMLVVVCLEDGGKEKIVRARDMTSKRIYKARVTDKGRLHELSVEN